MTTNIAINGFGRIGRNILRLLYAGQKSDLRVVAVNDLTSPETLAHLLKYDSVHGRFGRQVRAGEGSIRVDNDEIKVFAEKDPAKLPWGEQKVDVVLECTGLFTKKEKAAAHIAAGARKVIISAPSPDPDATIVIGVNDDTFKPDAHHIISCASCTTNCLAPVAKVLLENFGLTRGTMTTIHAYTNDQNVMDLPHKDLRRARAAALSMIPTTTGAAKALGLVIPKLAGKLDGFSVRVPTPDVSVVDFAAQLEQDVSVDDINRAFRTAASNTLKGILAVSDEPLVSIDYVGDTHSAIVDSLSTMVVDKRLAKVVAWYDNEMGFSKRMIELAGMLAASKK